MKRAVTLLLSSASLMFAAPSLAQELEDAGEDEAAIAEVDAAEEDENVEETNPDESADALNSLQQLEQTFTLRRTINGEVVETTKKTITLSPGVPYRATEASETALEQVRAEFDSEVLTRVEAFEEAKLDFTIADLDRDGRMTETEFVNLVDTWRSDDADEQLAPAAEDDRRRQYDAMLDPGGATEDQYVSYAKAKFSFISGASETISREDFIREYLLDFDTMDINDDTLLRGDELLQFRAANRGETMKM